MTSVIRIACLAGIVCGGQAADAPRTRLVRVTGTIQAVRSNNVQVPQVESEEGGRLTLLKLVPNGAAVKEGDVIAEFDTTKFRDKARDAKARFDDLAYQVRQRIAQNKSEAEKRLSDIQQAQGDLDKALIQLKKGPVLPEVDRLQNEERAATARLKVESLKKIDEARTRADQAALRILELQRDRQKVALDRALANIEDLVLRARYNGMVALQWVWRNGSMGPAQEGDKLWNGESLLSIFDPEEMEVLAMVGEPDAALLKPGTKAKVLLDAYPGAEYVAHFHAASPVATAATGSPIKNFLARFRLDSHDSRLLPDLSAALVITVETKP